MLRAVAIASLSLLSTAAVAEDLWLTPTAALAARKRDCLNGKDQDLRIESCSTMIQQNPNDILAYHNRGDAYGLKGDIDRAISNYSKAIELNPSYAPAYNSRGRAYASKGDYIAAVGDVTKAGELARKERSQKGPRKPLEESWWAWAIRKLTN